jgi:trimeric autotransporter adhesin
MIKKVVSFAFILLLTGGLYAASGTGEAELNPVTQSGWVEGTRPVQAEVSVGGKIMSVDTYWRTAGNAETTPGTHFLGTTDDQPLEIKVNGSRALLIHPMTHSPTLVGGSFANSADGMTGSFIGGGGLYINPNRINANYSVVVGGGGNSITSGGSSFIGGGSNNTVHIIGGTITGGTNNTVYGSYSFIGGGSNNNSFINSGYSFIGGGYSNSVHDEYATVGGGYSNRADSSYCCVLGGYSNSAANRCATVGGGYGNKAQGIYSTVSGGRLCRASGSYSVVFGGHSNEALGSSSVVCGGRSNQATATYSYAGGGYGNKASGLNSMVPGGLYNEAAGSYSFAAGREAKANNTGSFVWGDNQGSAIASTGSNQFIVRSSGGIWFGSNSSPSIPSGQFIATSTGAYLSSGGTWTNASDRNLKEGFSPVNESEILAKVSELPITSWNYKSEDRSVTHIGPVAQDFNAAFNLGNDERSISTVDADGVALVAIKALYNQNLAKDAEISQLRNQLADLETRLEKLENDN